jgi:LSD1 subclass zinc finger protein
MKGILNKINYFMNGRYGIDDIYKDGFILYLILVILDIFVDSILINSLQLTLILTLLYRSFSKNINIRKKENDKYLKLKNKIIKPIKDIKKRLNDDYHIYKKCHHCKTILRLPIPNKRGIKHVKCPTCKKRNTYFIFKKLKVEIIK